jgi:hypothetical protein
MKLFSSIKFRLFLEAKSKLKRPGCSNLVDDFADHLTYTNPAIIFFNCRSVENKNFEE